MIGGYPNNYIEDRVEIPSKYFLYSNEGKIEGQRKGRKRLYDTDEDYDEEDPDNFKF